MALERLTDFIPREDAGRASHLFADVQNIRILIYTDDPAVQDENNETAAFGLGLLRKFMVAQQSDFGKPVITVVNRNGTSCETQHASRKLTSLPLDDFDQIWFFGIHMANLTETICNGSYRERGGRESELTDDEVAVLLDWMQTRGVLVTGDHSSARSRRAIDTNLPPLLSLGRALGHRVPRAGELRTWQGGPTVSLPVSFNTQEPRCGKDINFDELLQGDERPQRIIALRLDNQGNPDAEAAPHFLFRGRDRCVIDVLPDHTHEGEVIELTVSPSGGNWPAGAPRPFVVAVGTDKRFGKTYNMVAVYNGTGGNSPTGRIVVDSTWHHYFNMNLTGFASDLSKGSVADLLGQYYYNLAVWLSSREKQRQMARAAGWWLANHPIIAEEGRVPAQRIGSVARALLARVASPSQINEMLTAYTPEEVWSKLPMLYYPEDSSALDSLPSQELILGSVINQYFMEMENPAPDSHGLDKREEGAASDRLIKEGLKEAFNAHAENLSGTRTQAEKFRDSFN